MAEKIQQIQMPGRISEEALQEQAERAEYVKNIGIEYRFGCYEEKRAESCQLLGEYMEALQQNFSAALSIFKKNCEENSYPKSCFKYGMYMLAGKTGDDSSLSKMIRPMKIACDANIPQGCRYLSLVHWNGEKDRKADSEKAERYMRRACELEDGEACWLLSTWYMGNKEKFKTTASGEAKELDRSELGQLSRDMEKSLQYAIRACDLDIAQSCANVSRMFKLGDGIPKDLDKAKKYADRAKEIMDSMRSNDTNAGFTG